VSHLPLNLSDLDLIAATVSRTAPAIAMIASELIKGVWMAYAARPGGIDLSVLSLKGVVMSMCVMSPKQETSRA